MAEAQITKQALAQALKRLMQKEPLSKISVGESAQESGVNRQTFYYHFRDKYELVNWIYYTETLPYMGSFSDRANWTEGLCALCRYMQRNKRFYINALNTPGQNSFQEYLTEFAHALVRALAEDLAGESHCIEEEELEFIADFYAFAFVGLIMKWAQEGMKREPDGYIRRIRELVDGSLLEQLRARTEKRTRQRQ